MYLKKIKIKLNWAESVVFKHIFSGLNSSFEGSLDTVSIFLSSSNSIAFFPVPFFRGSLEGKREQKSYKALLEDPMLRFSGLYQENCSDLYVTCQVFAEGKPLALPVRTSYKAFSTRWKWVVILIFCVCVCVFEVSGLFWGSALVAEVQHLLRKKCFYIIISIVLFLLLYFYNFCQLHLY